MEKTVMFKHGMVNPGVLWFPILLLHHYLIQTFYYTPVTVFVLQCTFPPFVSISHCNDMLCALYLYLQCEAVHIESPFIRVLGNLEVKKLQA